MEKVHEGEHFLFNYVDGTNSQGEFSLSSYHGQGYTLGPIKGVITINCARKRVNMVIFLVVYLRVNQVKKYLVQVVTVVTEDKMVTLVWMEYNGGTPFILDNVAVAMAVVEAVEESTPMTQQNTHYYSCMKGSQCLPLINSFLNPLVVEEVAGRHPKGSSKHGGNNCNRNWWRWRW